MTDLSLDLSACGDFCGKSSTAEGAILSGELWIPALVLASCSALSRPANATSACRAEYTECSGACAGALQSRLDGPVSAHHCCVLF